MYVAVDEGSGIMEELDSGQTKIMETGGKAHTTELLLIEKLRYIRILAHTEVPIHWRNQSLVHAPFILKGINR